MSTAFIACMTCGLQAGEGNDVTDKEGADDTLEAMPPKSASQASRASKASRKKVNVMCYQM